MKIKNPKLKDKFEILNLWKYRLKLWGYRKKYVFAVEW